MPRRRASLAAAALAVFASACSTDSSITSLKTPGAASENQAAGRGVFQRYTAIGTSVSMGVQSDGVVAAFQETAWPALLAAMGGRDLALPLIAAPGCPAPLAAPLISGLRTDGSPALPAGSGCAPLQPGVTLPVDNVAINGATTVNALLTTPEATSDPLYSRVLQPGQTQVSTMVASSPKLVSVELGANDVLGVISGALIPGVTITPYAQWQTAYDAVLDATDRVTKMALLVGLPTNLANLPSFRTGIEISADAPEFLFFHIAVAPDCVGNTNLIFLPFKLAPVLAAAQFAAAHGLPAVPFSCAAGATLTQDFVLTPAEFAAVNAQVAAMNAHIQSEAANRGFAYFSLGALYDRASVKPPLSLTQVLMTPTPFGPLMSLDGVHPSAAGQAILAAAAAHALNVTYKFGIPE